MAFVEGPGAGSGWVLSRFNKELCGSAHDHGAHGERLGGQFPWIGPASVERVLRLYLNGRRQRLPDHVTAMSCTMRSGLEVCNVSMAHPGFRESAPIESGSHPKRDRPTAASTSSRQVMYDVRSLGATGSSWSRRPAVDQSYLPSNSPSATPRLRRRTYREQQMHGVSPYSRQTGPI